MDDLVQDLAQHILTQAFKGAIMTTQSLAQFILTLATNRLGGVKAWERLSKEARFDQCRAEAWEIMLSQTETTTVVDVGYLKEAMSYLYENL